MQYVPLLASSLPKYYSSMTMACICIYASHPFLNTTVPRMTIACVCLHLIYKRLQKYLCTATPYKTLQFHDYLLYLYISVTYEGYRSIYVPSPLTKHYSSMTITCICILYKRLQKYLCTPTPYKTLQFHDYFLYLYVHVTYKDYRSI